MNSPEAPTIIYPSRDPLEGMTPDEFQKKLTATLKGRVSSAYFFGSFAGNRLSPYSDVDIILIQETDKSFLERGKDFIDLYDVLPCLDLLIYTPEEFSRLTSQPTVGFWSSVVSSMRKFI